MIKSIINTKWGSAIIDSEGYYRLRKPYKGKPKVLIHRLIFEDCYKVTLLKNAVIHHKDHCTTNNNIENLELMSVGEHIAYHNSLRKQNTTQRINSSKNVGIKNVGFPISIPFSMAVGNVKSSITMVLPLRTTVIS